MINVVKETKKIEYDTLEELHDIERLMETDGKWCTTDAGITPLGRKYIEYVKYQ